MKNNMQDINEPKINLPEEIKLEDGTVIPVGDISYEASYLDGTHDPESFNGYILTFEVSGKGMAAIRIIPSMTDPDDAEHGVNYTEFTEDDEAGIDLSPGTASQIRITPAEEDDLVNEDDYGDGNEHDGGIVPEDYNNEDIEDINDIIDR
ncbi:hypothetical protein ABLT88_10385 [Acinetobacter radioresistens]|jgi:hypothetical protein|uniref:hypothetical protein n=1 Tax=Acinetobacter radioresistens TaxID=40216 RepID=UPI001D181F54|nr:hypothetical protein [Acinetobacter radioresistens]